MKKLSLIGALREQAEVKRAFATKTIHEKGIVPVDVYSIFYEFDQKEVERILENIESGAKKLIEELKNDGYAVVEEDSIMFRSQMRDIRVYKRLRFKDDEEGTLDANLKKYKIK